MRRVLTIAGIAAAALLAGTAPAVAQPPGPVVPPGGQSAGHDTSAAAKHGWGEPDRVEEFDGPALGDAWRVYDGPGHVGNGRRTPEAVSLEGGVMTITGSPNGDTAGMAWKPGQKYGRWEGRVKAPAGDETYNALLLLWPTAEDWPVGGELDFMEMTDHTRQTTQLFLHYGKDNKQIQGEVKVDGTQWHNWAVEWTPTHIAAFVDGEEWWRTTDTEKFPPGPMHLCIQLDWFPDGRAGDVQESTMMVDWVKQYTLDAATASGPAQPAEPAAEPAGTTGPAARTAPTEPAPTEPARTGPAPTGPAPTGTAPTGTAPTERGPGAAPAATVAPAGDAPGATETRAAVGEALDRAARRVEAAREAAAEARRRVEAVVAPPQDPTA